MNADSVHRIIVLRFSSDERVPMLPLFSVAMSIGRGRSGWGGIDFNQRNYSR